MHLTTKTYFHKSDLIIFSFLFICFGYTRCGLDYLYRCMNLQTVFKLNDKKKKKKKKKEEEKSYDLKVNSFITIITIML